MTGPKVQVLEDSALRPGLSPGHLTIIGDLVLGPGALLEFDLSTVAGDIKLGGILLLSFIDGFLPKVGDAFDFFDLSGVPLLGGFYRVMITGALGFGFDPALLGQGIVGVIEGDSVSEPASLALVPVGVLGLGGCAGRCRSDPSSVWSLGCPRRIFTGNVTPNPLAARFAF